MARFSHCISADCLRLITAPNQDTLDFAMWSFGRIWLIFAAIFCDVCSLSLAQTTTIHITSSLTLVDAFLQDKKTGLPILDLKKDDFRVLDNGRPVTITSFDSGENLGTRPVALWLVTICNQNWNGDRASRTFAGREDVFRAPLDRLQAQDSVGVAHWCDNGDAVLDLPAGKDDAAAIIALKNALKPIPFFVMAYGSRIGELSYAHMARMIIRDARQENPQPLPVMVMLHGDYDGMPLTELDRLTNDILGTGGIVFGIRTSALPEMSLPGTEQDLMFHYMAYRTGGAYYAVPPELFGDALANIIKQLHFRYQLGFVPELLDGKVHKLKVELTDDAKKRYENNYLSARSFYIPTPVGSE